MFWLRMLRLSTVFFMDVTAVKTMIVANFVVVLWLFYRCVKVLLWLHYDCYNSVYSGYGYCFMCVYGYVMTMLQLFTSVLKLSGFYSCFTIIFTAVTTFFLLLWLYGYATAVIIGFVMAVLQHCLCLHNSWVKLMIVIFTFVLWLFYRYGYSYGTTLTAMLQKCLQLCYGFYVCVLTFNALFL